MTDRDGGPDAPPADDAPAPWPRAAERAEGARDAVTQRSHELPPRPRVEVEEGILGFSRLTRGRFGSRLFTLFFVAVYAVIALNLVISLLSG
jgi:hypothetical protein